MKWAVLAISGCQISIQSFISPGRLASHSTQGTASVSYTETQTVTYSFILYHQHLFVQVLLPDFNQPYLLTGHCRQFFFVVAEYNYLQMKSTHKLMSLPP